MASNCYIKSVTLDPTVTSTVTANSRILSFEAFVTTSGSDLPSAFEISLWWSPQDLDWVASPFKLVTSDIPFSAVSRNDDRLYHFALQFVPPLSSKCVKFSAKYRLNLSSDWVWCQDFGTFGRVILHRPSATAVFPPLGALFTESSENLEGDEMMSEVVDSRVWKVTGIASARKQESTFLGKPADMHRYMALVRIQGSWLGPRHGSNAFTVDRPALMVLFQREDGYSVCVLPLSNMKSLVTTYMHSDEGKIVLDIDNACSEHKTYSVFVGISRDPYKAVQSALYSLRSFIQSYHGALIQDAEPEGPVESTVATTLVQPLVQKEDSQPVSGTWYEDWMDMFGFCTWNSMGIEVSHDKIMAALHDLDKSGIHVGLVIIDDGWQVTNQDRQIMRFEANERFPKGLKYTVDTIKQTFPYIRHVAVWHALLGYWGGVSPDGDLAKNYKLTKGKLYNQETYIISEKDVGRYYNDFYKFLANSGITVVKADVQMHIYDMEGDKIVGTYVYKAYQNAIKLSSTRYFYRRMTYCMSMSAQYFYYSLLQTTSPKPALRNSDDFFPNIPSSHHWHIFCNAMNAVLTSLLHAVPDWDMFMTNLKPYSPLHAAARCVSGGPVYITDAIGLHDMDLISQVQAETIRGTSVSLRPSRFAVPLDPYFALSQRRLLWLRNFIGGTGGFGILAAFNVHEDETVTFVEPVKLSMVPGMVAGAEYVLYSYKTSATTEFQGQVSGSDADRDTLMVTKIANSDWDVFTAAPLATVQTGQRRAIKIGALGMLGHISGAAAIERQRVTVPKKGRAILDVDLKVLGVLGVYISDFGVTVEASTKLLITIQGTVIPLDTISSAGNVLKIDVAKAWKDLNLNSRWSNEILLRIYIT
ncbi:glycoside hydrolase superfamily [Lipomyces arxii]|uniref:glycoside hydrolase superfamily n=1 Tax=Lipomyces arxii TaxID=56418 RepID=UPI0034CEAA5C